MLCALPRAVAVKDRDGAMPQPPLYSAQNILRKEETHIAIFHCTIKLVQRSKGKSVVAAAAYRSGTKMVNEWDGMTHDYTRKGGVVHAEIMLPAHAPPEFQDRAILWNSVEQIEKFKDSQLAREVEVALPVELSREQQLSLVRSYVKDNFVDKGMCADFAIHDRDTGNPHAHILLTVRPLKENGEWGAKCRKVYELDERGQRVADGRGGWKNHREDTTDWNNKEQAEVWRSAWADYTNQALEAAGKLERIDHRSYQRQGVQKIPSVHLGVAAKQMEKRGIVTRKGDLNRQITADNKLLKEIKARIARLHRWSKDFAIHDRDTGNPHAHILLTVRPLKENGEWGAKCRKVYELDERGQRVADGRGGWKNHREDTTDWNNKEQAEVWRSAWADYTNQALEAAGKLERIDHRSYQRQGVQKIPSVHLGVAAKQMEKRGIVTRKGDLNRQITADNKLLKEIKARIARLHRWSKDEAAKPQSSQPTLLQLWETQQAMRDKPTSRYEALRKLREQAALYNSLAANGITTMQQLHEKVDAMNAQYYKLRGEIVSAERRIATLEERLDMFEKYEKNKAVQRQYVKVKPAKREQFEQSYRAELTLYKAAVRYLENLKTEGEPVTPKKWRSEVESLTAQKNLQYQEMRAMREEIKAVEKLKKAAERLEKEAQAKEKKRNEPER